MKGIRNRINIYKDYIGRRSHAVGLPVEIGIEMTNHCNLGCTMCPREEMTRTEGSMPYELFTKIIDEIKDYAELIYLHGDGEPFIHKRLFDAIRYAKKSGLRVGMSTNATILTEARARELIDAKIDYLILAIDGNSKESYEKIRLRGNFEQVRDNIRRFLQLAHQKRSKIFSLVQIIEMDENKHEIEEFYRFWKQYRPGVVRIKRLYDFIWKQRAVQFKSPCFYIWRSTMIDWDGTVFPCCVDTNSVENLGNMAEKSLREIWNASPMVRLRNAHIRGKQNEIPICNTCDQHKFNTMEAFGVSLLSGYMCKRLLPYVENLGYLYKTVTKRKELAAIQYGLNE